MFAVGDRVEHEKSNMLGTVIDVEGDWVAVVSEHDGRVLRAFHAEFGAAPTPEEIDEMTAEIRATWTPFIYEKRSTCIQEPLTLIPVPSKVYA